MDDRREIERFLRTLRVATAAALAEYDLSGEDALAGTGSRFLALAAQSAEGWRFPAEGLHSVDGRLLVRLDKDQAGLPRGLSLQALGASGMELYAGRAVAIQLGRSVRLETRFDRDGRAEASLAGLDLTEADFATFSVEAAGVD